MSRHPAPEEIAAARAALAAADPDMALIHSLTPSFVWRTQPGGFAGLVRILTGQQVSTASADAIWARLEAALGGFTAGHVIGFGEPELRALGLSQQKARYVREIAAAELDGRVDFEALKALPDEEAITVLTAIKGVGRWTAEIYLMFTEGRADLFPALDLALQEALRAARGDAARLSERALRERAELWRPWRGVAAHLLWRFYAGLKRREISPPAPPPRR